MTRWNAYWYGPVAAVRPYLWLQGLLVLVALDVWALRVGRAGLYGAYGFNVAHFDWLDVVAPVPSPGLHAGVLVLTGLLAFTLALTPMSRLALAGLTILYTYSWAMSMRDLFQHHYLISLFLLCAVVFPGSSAQEVARRPAPRSSAPGYALLRTTAAIVYAFAAVAKLDGEWLTGRTLRSIGRAEAAFAPLTARLTDEAVFAFLARATIVGEALLAVALVAACARDTATGARARLAFSGAALLGIVLHASFETLGLHIGWFTAYMLLLVCVVFLPEAWLLTVVALARRPARWAASLAPAPRAAVPLAGVVGLALVLVGRALDVPGAVSACGVGAAVLVAVTVVASRRTPPAPALRTVGATAVAACAMWATIASSSARFRLYNERFDYLHAMGDLVAARHTAEKAARYAPRGDAEVESRVGYMAQQVGDPAGAVAHYRRALAIDPACLDAANNLAWLLATHANPTVRMPAEAVRLAEHAATLTEWKSPGVLDTLAAAYAAAGRRDDAARTARTAIDLAEQAGDDALATDIDERAARYERGLP